MKNLLFTFLLMLGTFCFSQETIRFSAFCYKVIDQDVETIQERTSENISRFVLEENYMKLDDLLIKVIHSQMKYSNGTEYLVIIGETNGDRMPIDVVIDLTNFAVFVNFPEVNFTLLFEIIL